MLVALYIIVDEDLGDPIYADPDPGDIEPEVWNRVGEILVEVRDNERPSDGAVPVDEFIVGWRVMVRNQLAFVAVVQDVSNAQLERYLKQLQRQYFDEVDDVRKPEREGVVDVVVDVIPPWEDED